MEILKKYRHGGQAPQGQAPQMQAPQGGGQGPSVDELLEFLASYDPNAPVGALMQDLNKMGVSPGQGPGGPPQGQGGGGEPSPQEIEALLMQMGQQQGR